MIFWGTTIDPSKAKRYEVPLIDNVLPVHIEVPVTATPTATKVLAKPTALLPGDHGTAPGENTNPAFSSALPSATATSTPTGDEGWFPGMANLVSNQKWFFVALGAVGIFGIGIGAFFWRRRAARLASYTTLPAGDDMSMSALVTGHRGGVTGSRPTKELYDAFGEVSDDDDDDEETALRGAHPKDRVSTGLGFHSGFLDDDEPASAGAGPTPLYRDEPDRLRGERNIPSRASSPSGSGGSWEHASTS